MKPFLRLLILSIMCQYGLIAEEVGLIRGRIIDVQTGEPLANAILVVVGTQRGDVSNYAGEFLIGEVPAGRQSLKASLLGYVTRQVEAQIEPNLTLVVDVRLDQDDAIRLEEILVTANRVNVYPQANLLAQDVDRRSPKDVGEFLRATPGCSCIRKGGTAMDPVIRGFRQDQVNVQVDGGMKMWGACPNRMDPPTSHIQAEDLEKIEVLKGPFSVRFGPTFGPVVNLVMEKPEQFAEPGVRARVEGGYESNWNGKRSRAALTTGLPAADLFLSGGVKRFGSYEAGDGSEVQSGFSMSDYSLKLGVNPADHQRIQFTNRGSYMRDVYYPALPMDAIVDDTHMYAVDYVGKSFDGLLSSLSAKGYFSSVHHIMSNLWKPTYATMHSEADVQSKTAGGRVEAMLLPSGIVALYAGVDGYDLMKSGDRLRKFVSGPNNGKTLLDTVWQDSHILDVGTFVEARSFFGDGITTITGIRVDHVRVHSDKPNSYFASRFGRFLDVTENNVSAAASVMYTLNPSVDMKLGLGHGKRTADITERFVYIQPVGMDRYDYIGNPALRPEGNTQLDLAVGARLAGWTLQGSVYHSFLHDFISARVDTTVKKVSADALGVKRFVNVTNASLSGYEISASTLLISGFELDLSVAYTYGQNLDIDEPLPEILPLNGVALMRYQQQEDPLWVELEGRFVAKQNRVSLTFQEQATPGFAVYSLRAGTEIFNHVGVTAGIQNILNKSYYEHLNRKSRADGRPILEPGRTFSVNVQFMY